jgi:DNA-binding transcriptional LysR family regulator
LVVEFRQVQYFVAVAEQLNFGRAAQALSVGQPVVSQQIARLERELGSALFERTSRVVRLTEAGQRFLPEARAVLVAVERACRAAQGAPAGDRRLIRLGSSTGLGERLEQVLEAMRVDAPQLEVELVSAPTRVRLERVRAGQLDAAFVRGIDSAARLEIVPVWQDPLLVALPASHLLAGAGRIALADLAALPLRIVSRSLNQPLVDLVMTACAEAGFEPVLGPRLENLQNTLAEIGTGSPSWTVLYAAQADAMRSTRVAFRPLAEPGLTMPTALAISAQSGSRSLGPLLRACASAQARID